MQPKVSTIACCLALCAEILRETTNKGWEPQKYSHHTRWKQLKTRKDTWTLLEATDIARERFKTWWTPSWNTPYPAKFQIIQDGNQITPNPTRWTPHNKDHTLETKRTKPTRTTNNSRHRSHAFRFGFAPSASRRGPTLRLAQLAELRPQGLDAPGAAGPQAAQGAGLEVRRKNISTRLQESHLLKTRY